MIPGQFEVPAPGVRHIGDVDYAMERIIQIPDEEHGQCDQKPDAGLNLERGQGIGLMEQVKGVDEEQRQRKMQEADRQRDSLGALPIEGISVIRGDRFGQPVGFVVDPVEQPARNNAPNQHQRLDIHGDGIDIPGCIAVAAVDQSLENRPIAEPDDNPDQHHRG